MARCLVTGHKGYIGSHLFRTLQELGHEVQGIDLKEKYPKDILDVLKENHNKSGFHPHYQNFKPEYIFHLAAIPRVPYSIENPVEVMHNNIISNSMVLNFARKVGAKRVIYSSSSSVMGNGDGPESPYAVSKLAPELECKMYSKLYGLDTVCLRYFNVYSKDQKVDGPYGTAIASFMDAISRSVNPYITGDGKQRRDMLHVRDAVRANIFCMEYDNKFNGRHFDIGTGNNISLNEVKEIVNTYYPDVQFDYVDPRPGDIMITKANTIPINNLGWHTITSIYSGIEECFNFKGE